MYPAGIPGIIARPVTVEGGLALRAIEAGPPTGPAVLLVHGFGANVYTFAETLPVLAAAGFRAIAVDLPGHGLSAMPADESRFSRRALGDLVLGVASALGVTDFAIVGHSMGGGIALDMALRGEPRVSRVVLISSVGLGRVLGMGLLKVVTPRVVNRVSPAVLTRRTIEVLLRLAFASRERPLARDIEEYWAPTQFASFAHACRACVHRYDWKVVSALRLRSLRLPVLALSGGRDLMVRGAHRRAAQMPGARVVTIPEGGHLVLQECSSQTNVEILRFLTDG